MLSINILAGSYLGTSIPSEGWNPIKILLLLLLLLLLLTTNSCLKPYYCVWIIIIISEYSKPYNGVQISCIKNIYYKV